MPRVLLSAAHTLENPGEVFGDLREADITRKILKKTLPYLDNLKIENQAVPLDLQLLKRIDWINQTGYTKEQGDIFIEIHVNDGGKRGIEGWFEGGASATNNSQKLANSVLESVCKYTGYQNQGAKSEYEHDLGSLIILNQINPIATAVEFLYIDNPEDNAILRDDSKLESLAKAFADSINDFIKNVSPTLKFIPTSTPASLPSFGGMGGGQIKPNFGAQSPFAAAPLQSGQSIQSSFGGGSKTLVMDRDERKEMIKRVYLKVLGKEPTQNDLNYNLNTGASEFELTKKLIEGPDHEKMLEDSKQFKTLNDRVQQLEAEVNGFKIGQVDAKAMQESMNRLMEHKNMLISRLNQELVNNNIIVHGVHIDSYKPQNKDISAPSSQNFIKKKKGLTELLMDIFKL